MTQVPSNTYYVDTSFTDSIVDHEFNTIQAAINQIPYYARAKIVLYSNLTNIPTLILTNGRTNITIDGGNTYGIHFTPGMTVVDIGERQTLKFVNMSHIRGSEIIINNSMASVGFYNCISVMAFLTLTSGTYSTVYIHNSNIYGTFLTDPIININNGDVKIEISNSLIQGAYNHPAIIFNVESVKKLKIKNSSILHGNDEIQAMEVNGTFVPEIIMYNCYGDTKITDSGITNWVVNDDNTINTNIQF